MPNKPLMLSCAVALACGATIAGPAPAQETAEAAAPTDGSRPAVDKSKKVCRNIVKSGTRMSQRYCRLESDWEKDAETAGRYLEDGQMNGYRRDGEMNTQSGVNQPPR